MKVLVVGHANVHLRQILFFKKLSESIEVVAAGPRSWRNLQANNLTEGNFKYVALSCNNEGDLTDYSLCGFDDLVDEVKPDLIYAQAEPASRMAGIVHLAAMERKIPFVIFTWENIRKFEDEGINRILDDAAGIICGNNDAYRLLKVRDRFRKMTTLPQVGIDLSIFKPMNVEKSVDVLYVGRKTAEKGVNVITDACARAGFTLKTVSNAEYLELPAIYNSARIFASLPIETSFWKEQSGSYTNLEAMACGVPVITTDCGAIPEYLGDAPFYVHQQNGFVHPDTFINDVKLLLEEKSYYNTKKEIGLWQAAKYSNEKIAERLIAALNAAL